MKTKIKATLLLAFAALALPIASADPADSPSLQKGIATLAPTYNGVNESVRGKEPTGTDGYIGKYVEVYVAQSDIADAPPKKFVGKFVAVIENWVIIRDGTYDKFLPAKKVLEINISR